jgi:hypothetical protein
MRPDSLLRSDFVQGGIRRKIPAQGQQSIFIHGGLLTAQGKNPTELADKFTERLRICVA